MASYRERSAACPACAARMEERLLPEATVDVCPACRGLWVDWFDGDLLAVAHATAPLSMRAPVSFDASLASCPRCQKPMIPETFAEVAFLLRCGECAGTFVPRAAFTALMEFEPPPDPAPGDEDEPEGISRLLAILRRLLG